MPDIALRKTTLLVCEHCADLIGGTAVYREGRIFKLVRITGVSTDEDFVELALEPIEAEGFTRRPDKLFSVGAQSDLLSIQRNHLASGYCNWRLFVEPSVVEHLIRFARGGPSMEQIVIESRKMMRSR